MYVAVVGVVEGGVCGGAAVSQGLGRTIEVGGTTMVNSNQSSLILSRSDMPLF